jgi:uncharacterized protein (DUF3820 family)
MFARSKDMPVGQYEVHFLNDLPAETLAKLGLQKIPANEKA